MNGQEAVATAIAMGENFEPQSKRQKMESDGEGHMNFETLMPSKTTEIGK